VYSIDLLAGFYYSAGMSCSTRIGSKHWAGERADNSSVYESWRKWADGGEPSESFCRHSVCETRSSHLKGRFCKLVSNCI